MTFSKYSKDTNNEFVFQPLIHMMKLLKWAGRMLLWSIVKLSILPAEAYSQYDEYGMLIFCSLRYVFL